MYLKIPVYLLQNFYRTFQGFDKSTKTANEVRLGQRIKGGLTKPASASRIDLDSILFWVPKSVLHLGSVHALGLKHHLGVVPHLWGFKGLLAKRGGLPATFRVR